MSSLTAGRQMYRDRRSPGDDAWLLATDEETTPVILDLSLFTEPAHYQGGRLRSGILLGMTGTEPGRFAFGPFDPKATDGRSLASGLLYPGVRVPAGATTVQAELLAQGRVDVRRLPIAPGLPGGLDDRGRYKLLLPRIQFRTR